MFGAGGKRKVTRTYLDHNATSPLRPGVREVMLPLLKADFGNPSSVHREGQLARAAVEQARGHVAALMGAERDEIIFTSGATEANNLALLGMAEAARRRGRRRIVTSCVEHPSVLGTVGWLESQGFGVDWLPVSTDGQLDLEQYGSVLGEETAFVSIMLANNETGICFPIPTLASMARGVGAWFHTDAVQGASSLQLAEETAAADLVTISGHKIGGPKGTGALQVRDRGSLAPVFHGGHQERSLRPGTENVPAIVGFGAAVEHVARERHDFAARSRVLQQRFEARLQSEIPDLTIQGSGVRRLPTTTCVTFPGIAAEAAVAALDLRGVACSAGAACATGSVDPSHVLLAMGTSVLDARASLRFSLGPDTSAEELDMVAATLPGLVAGLREVSELRCAK